MIHKLRGISHKCLRNKLRGRLVGFKEKSFIKGDLVVLCNTDKSCIDFANWCLEHGITKLGETKIEPNVYDMSWNTYANKTAYIIKNINGNSILYYACLDFFISEGYRVCKWERGSEV